jgi:hypothetical protein
MRPTSGSPGSGKGANAKANNKPTLSDTYYVLSLLSLGKGVLFPLLVFGRLLLTLFAWLDG